MEASFKKIIFYFYLIFVVILSFQGLKNYQGTWYYYLIFTLIFNLILLNGFGKNRIFFDTFIGGFLWLGFWLKFTVRTVYFNGEFADPIGIFNHTSQAFDRVLITSTVGGVGFLVASYIRKKFFYSRDNLKPVNVLNYLSNFYNRFKTIILPLFVLVILLFAISNSWLGIYQRGTVSRTILPFGLSGIYTWLLFFGFSSFSSFFVFFELKKGSDSWVVIIISLVECFFSNVSMLSRGFILNASSLALGIDEQVKNYSLKIKNYYKIIFVLFYLFLFVLSVYGVNYLRSQSFFDKTIDPIASTVQKASIRMDVANVQTKALFIDRWVGVEGVMAISSYSNLGWNIWSKAWREKYYDFGSSFYDREIAKTPGIGEKDFTEHHFISLPGLVAFFFYPGSYLFLFTSIFLLAVLASVAEFLAFKFSGGNLIFCSLVGQVIAYRFIHFGYVPRQSYLLFGTIFVNIFLFYAFDKLLSFKRISSK